MYLISNDVAHVSGPLIRVDLIFPTLASSLLLLVIYGHERVQ